MLAVNRASRWFEGLSAVADATVSVAAGECVGLVGPNGSGKSTLLNMISGFVPAQSGTIRFAEHDITHVAPWKIARAGLRRTFQMVRQPERMSVVEVMLCGAQVLPRSEPLLSVFGRDATRASRAEIERAVDLLRLMGLEDRGADAAGTLSAGQQRLLGLALALMGQPRMLLLDEPTAGINPTLHPILAAAIVDRAGQGVGILIVEHDLAFVADVCSRVYVLDRGHVIADCPPGELATRAEVIEAYLGTGPGPGASR